MYSVVIDQSIQLFFVSADKDKSPAYSNFSDFSSKDLRLDIENVFLSAVN